MLWPALLTAFFLLTPLVVWSMRRDYRRRGRLTWRGFGLLVVWFFIPHLTLDFATRHAGPWTPTRSLGLAVGLLGLATTLLAIVSFRSPRKVFGFGPGRLTVTGPYRWSRNPQYLGWFLFVLGYALTGWTWRCWISLALLALALYVLIRVEEEHLGRVFGDAYRALCARVPRILGRGRRADREDA